MTGFRKTDPEGTHAALIFARLAAVAPLFLVALSCAGEPAAGGSSTYPARDGSSSWATELRVVKMPASPIWEVKDIDVLESHPVKFTLELVKRYPTAGWRVALAGVEDTEPPGIVRVRIIEAAPPRPVAQVITPLAVRVPLGSLKTGRYGFRVLVKKTDERQYESIQTIELEAN